MSEPCSVMRYIGRGGAQTNQKRLLHEAAHYYKRNLWKNNECWVITSSK